MNGANVENKSDDDVIQLLRESDVVTIELEDDNSPFVDEGLGGRQWQSHVPKFCDYNAFLFCL